MVYTVEECCRDRVLTQTYDGFCKVSSGNLGERPREANFLAAVRVEDTVELWWLADRGPAVEELQRYYRCRDGRNVRVVLFLGA